MSLEIIYSIYMCKKDLALNNRQWLICHKTKSNNIYIYTYIYLAPDWTTRFFFAIHIVVTWLKRRKIEYVGHVKYQVTWRSKMWISKFSAWFIFIIANILWFFTTFSWFEYCKDFAFWIHFWHWIIYIYIYINVDWRKLIKSISVSVFPSIFVSKKK